MKTLCPRGSGRSSTWLLWAGEQPQCCPETRLGCAGGHVHVIKCKNYTILCGSSALPMASVCASGAVPLQFMANPQVHRGSRVLAPLAAGQHWHLSLAEVHNAVDEGCPCALHLCTEPPDLFAELLIVGCQLQHPLLIGPLPALGQLLACCHATASLPLHPMPCS